MTYAGTASGRMSAHSNKPRPGKRHIVVSQAVATPITVTPMPTPTMSPSVLPTYSGNTVETRCDQVSPLGVSTLPSTTSTGTASTPAAKPASSDTALQL